MDFNEAVPSLLIIVIVLLYYLYRIKKKKLHEEEQKYIETFLIRDRDISHLRAGSPFKKGAGSPAKINKFRNQDSQLKGPDSPLIGKNISKSLGKMSPVRKTSASLQGKTSPKVGSKLQFSDEIGNYQSPKTKLEYTSPKRVQNEAQSKVYNFESIRLQKIQEEDSNSKTKTPEKLDSRGNLNAKFRAMHDTKPSSTGFEDSNVVKSPNLVENRQPQPQEDLKVKEIAVRKDSAATKGKREICFVESDSESDHEQVRIVHDSSFEEEPQNQEEIRPEANKRQPPGKSTIYLEYLEDLGSGMGLKKYIAKKTVQEYVPYTDNSSKTISQLLSSQKVARVTQKIATAPIATNSQTATTSQAAKPQGGMFASTTSTTAATPSTQGQTTTAAPANKGGIFGGSTSQPQSTATTSATANKPQGGGLFGNSTASTTTTQSGAPAAGATGGGIFGNKTAQTSTPTTTNNTTAAAKPSGGLFNTQPQTQGQPAAKPQGTAGTAPLQVKTTGLFGNAAQGADKNPATPLFPKGDQPQTTQPSGKGRERSGGIEDFEGNSLKKMNIK